MLRGYGDAGNERSIKWLRKSEMPDEVKYTNPTSNPSGASAWCILDGDGLRRVHVCAHFPCRARHESRGGAVAASKYGQAGPPDDHMRIYLPRHAHIAPTASAPSGTLVSAPPPSPSSTPIGVSAPTPTASAWPGPSFRPMTPEHSCSAALLSPSTDVPSPPSSEHSTPRSVVADEPIYLCSPAAVAPPPRAVVPLPGAVTIQPPARATLQPLVGAATSSNCPLPQLQLAPLSVGAAVPPPADEDNEDSSVVAELSNPQVAVELSYFLDQLLKPRRWVGIAAFVLFAIVFQKRVRIRYVDSPQDIVATYAPWAATYITEWATVNAVACKVSDGHLSMCDFDKSAFDMNHWVGACPCEGPEPFGAVALQDEKEQLFFTHYLSHRLRNERTEACGDCGLDTMSLMLGEKRSLETRTQIRRRLVQFVHRHRGNRALISMLSETGELKHNLGDSDLESAAQELFTHRCRGVEQAEECSKRTLPETRAFTDEEIEAVRWKLHMHRNTAYSIARFMACLSEKMISSLVQQHKSVVAEPPAPKTAQGRNILGKDLPWWKKREALHLFFDWTKENCGLEAVQRMRREKKMPHGLFTRFVRGNTYLKHHCTENKKFATTNLKYVATLKRYQNAEPQGTTGARERQISRDRGKERDNTGTWPTG